MKMVFRPGWLAVWLLLAFAGAASAQLVMPKVASIEIKHYGPPAVSDAVVMAHIRVKVGEIYRRASVDDDIRNLYATGYFYNIAVDESNQPDGVKLVYRLQGNPTVTDIKFVGNAKYSKSKLMKKVTSKVGQPMDEKKLFTDAQEIQKQYQKSGYQKTTVNYTHAIDENTGKAIVTFEIK
jgi:outer membrane protein assembly factor BamA